MTMRTLVRALVAAIAACALGSTWLVPTRAVAQDEEIALESAIPAPDSEVPTSPSQLALTFTQELSSVGVSVFITDAAGNPQQRGNAQVGSDRRTAIVPLPVPLAAGEYRVDWRVTNALGRVVADSYTFTVGENTPDTTPVPDTTGTATTQPGSGGGTATTQPGGSGGSTSGTRSYGALAALARIVSYLGIAAFVGGIVLIVLVWNEGPEYVLTARFLRLSWAAGFVATLVLVATTAAEEGGRSVAAGLSPTAWGDAAATSPGKALVARLVLLALCAWVAAQPERTVDPSTQLAAVGLPLLVAVTLGLSRIGEGRFTTVAVPAGVVHALGVVIWFGGVALLARVVLTGPGEDDLVAAVRGFNRIATPAMFAAVAGGAVQTASLLGGLGNLVSTGYGRLFLLKVLVAVFMAYVAAHNRQVVLHRLSRSTRLGASAAARLRRAVSTEMLSGVLVFALSGLLVGTTPPAADNGGIPRDAIRRTLASADDEVVVQLVIYPGEVGTNGLRFTVDRPTEGLANVIVRLTDPAGRANGVVFTLPLTGAGTYDLPVEQGFPLGAAGTWNIEVAPTPVQGVLPTLQATMVVRNADGTTPETVPASSATTTTSTITSTTSAAATSTSAAGGG